MNPHHWYVALPLALLAMASFATGLICATLGATMGDSYSLLEDLLLRAFGLLMLAAGVSIMRHRRIGFWLAIAGFVAISAEFALSSLLAAHPHNTADILFVSCGLLGLAAFAYTLDFIEQNQPAPSPGDYGDTPASMNTVVAEDPHWLINLIHYLICGLSVTAISLMVSIPLTTFSLWFSVAALACLAVLFFILHGRIRFDERTLSPATGFLLAALLTYPFSGISFRIEHGYADGPFATRTYDSGKQSRPSYRLKYRDGMLAVYNREGQAPVLAYLEDGQSKWMAELYVPPRKGSRKPELLRISTPTVHRGLLRDKVSFSAQSANDTGQGEIYLWRFGGAQNFYLRW